MKQHTQIPLESDPPAEEQQPAEQQPLTVMAIQELLGLFRPKDDPAQDRHDYLKHKPLGLI